jgi:hypothetical protein
MSVSKIQSLLKMSLLQQTAFGAETPGGGVALKSQCTIKVEVSDRPSGCAQTNSIKTS